MGSTLRARGPQGPPSAAAPGIVRSLVHRHVPSCRPRPGPAPVHQPCLRGHSSAPTHTLWNLKSQGFSVGKGRGADEKLGGQKGPERRLWGVATGREAASLLLAPCDPTGAWAGGGRPGWPRATTRPGQGQPDPARLPGHRWVARYKTGHQITGSESVWGWPVEAHAGGPLAVHP